MAILTVQKPTTAGTPAALVAASSGGDSFPNTGTEFLRVANANVSLSRVVTFDSPGTCNFGLANNAAHDLAVTVASSSTVIIGPFPVSRFNDGNSRVQITYSAAGADLTVAAESST